MLRFCTVQTKINFMKQIPTTVSQLPWPQALKKWFDIEGANVFVFCVIEHSREKQATISLPTSIEIMKYLKNVYSFNKQIENTLEILLAVATKHISVYRSHIGNRGFCRMRMFWYWAENNSMTNNAWLPPNPDRN